MGSSKNFMLEIDESRVLVGLDHLHFREEERGSEEGPRCYRVECNDVGDHQDGGCWCDLCECNDCLSKIP